MFNLLPQALFCGRVYNKQTFRVHFHLGIIVRLLLFAPHLYTNQPFSSTERAIFGENLMERATGIEPVSSAWKAEVIAIIPCPRNSNIKN